MTGDVIRVGRVTDSAKDDRQTLIAEFKFNMTSWKCLYLLCRACFGLANVSYKTKPSVQIHGNLLAIWMITFVANDNDVGHHENISWSPKMFTDVVTDN